MTFRKRASALASLILITGLLTWAVAPARAGTTEIVVTTSEDELNNDGDCGLREAIQAANTNVAVDACVAGSPTTADTIKISGYRCDCEVFKLTRKVSAQDDDANQIGDLDIAGPTIFLVKARPRDLITIDARADVPTLDGDGFGANPCEEVEAAQVGNNSRVLHVLPGASLATGELWITGGYASAWLEDAGGGVLNEGSLELQGGLISRNWVVPRSDDAATVGAGGGIAELPGATTSIGASVGANGVVATHASGGGASFGATDAERTVEMAVVGNVVCGDYASGGGIAHVGDSTGWLILEHNSAIGKLHARGGGLANTGNSSSLEIATFVDGNDARGGEVTQGAGVYNDADLTLAKSNLNFNFLPSGNGVGAAIYNDGSLRMDRSSVSWNGGLNIGNRDDDFPHDIEITAVGGGLYSPGAAELTNSTFQRDEADLGAAVYVPEGGQVDLLNVTLFGNVGHESVGGLAVEGGGSASLRNSIVAYNHKGDCGKDEDDSISSVAYNLDTDGTCGLDSVGDMPNDHPELVSGMLVPRMGSPLIDAIPESGEYGCPPPSEDQRGVERPLDGDGDGIARCDIGSGERKSTDPRGICPGYENDPRHQVVGTGYPSRTVRGTAAPEILCGAGTRNWMYGYEGDDLLLGGGQGDNIYGHEGNDVIRARGGRDWIGGRGGADIIRGGSGEDNLNGERGNDRLFGGGGGDLLQGNFGDDELFGGTAFDKLVGGRGTDLCDVEAGGGSTWFCEDP